MNNKTEARNKFYTNFHNTNNNNNNNQNQNTTSKINDQATSQQVNLLNQQIVEKGRILF